MKAATPVRVLVTNGNVVNLQVTVDKAETRTKMMRRALKDVEALPDTQSQALLPMVDPNGDDSDT